MKGDSHGEGIMATAEPMAKDADLKRATREYAWFAITLLLVAALAVFKSRS
jgi:hypothetical protein